MTTDYVYNSLDQTLSQTTSSGTDSLAVSRTYDPLGRLASATAPGNLTTSYAYAKETDGSVTLTITYPDGGTEIRKHFQDGSLKSTEGSAVISSYRSLQTGKIRSSLGSLASDRCGSARRD